MNKRIAGQTRLEQALSDRSTVLTPAPLSVLQALPLSAHEGFLLSRFDGPMPLGDLLAVSGLGEPQAVALVSLLLDKGALMLPGEPVPPPPPPRRAPPTERTLPPTAWPAPPSERTIPPAARPATPPPVRQDPDRITVRVTTDSPREKRPDAAPIAPVRPADPLYGDFVFSLLELDEPADLDLARRKQILFLYYHLDSMTHYRVLGVLPTATQAELHEAFVQRSKQFHPDLFFRRELGSFRQKLDAIFRRVKEAHDVLSDPEARQRYDRDERHRFSPEEVQALVDREIHSLEWEKRSRTRRNQLLQARGFARLTRARERLADGDRALAQGNMADALSCYQQALDMDPRLDLARQRIAETRRLSITRRIDDAIEQAKEAMRARDYVRGVELLRGAVRLDGSYDPARLALAEALLAVGNFKEARIHAQAAIDHGELKGRAYLVLGEALLKQGQKKQAREALQTALEAGERMRAAALLKQC